jgi:Zn-dependent protease
MSFGGALRGAFSALDRSWRIGRLFGVEIRVHLATLLVPLFALWSAARAPYGGGFLLAYSLGSIAALYFVVLVHEFGHIFAARRFRMPSRLVTLSPLGGLAHLESPPPNPKAEIAVAAAGPATHVVWYLLVELVLRTAGPEGATRFVLEGFSALNLGLLLFNLLPFFPLDGGRVLRGLLALKLHPNRATFVAATVGLVGSVPMMIAGFFRGGFGGAILFLIGLRVLETCLRERLMAKFSEGPYARASSPWAFDDDAWREGRRLDGDEPERKRPGFFERRRIERAERARRRDAERRAELQAAIDRLLEKVSAAGLAGLTPRERDELKRASTELAKLKDRPAR